MKKYLLIVLSTMLFVLILLYFYDEKEEILNKEMIKEDVYIEYPYFSNQIIDSYMNSYLNKVITNNSDYKIFMDYDYHMEDEVILLTLYSYFSDNNILKSTVKNLKIDLSDNTITVYENMLNDTITYDGYYQKFIDSDKKMVALTFDDGPNKNTSKILDTLEKYGVHATFFILGCNIKGNEEVIRRMKDLNMEIGNHMYSHKLLTRMKDGAITKEISKVDKEIFNVIEEYPTLIRPSYGTINKRILKLIDRPIIIWNIDTLDWKYHNSRRISNSILNNVHDGDIVLMHDIYSATSNSLEITIPKLLDQGYQLVTVSELFYYKGVDLQKGNSYSHISN